MKPEALKSLVTEALEDMKAQNIVAIDVRGKTAITDFMVIATGTSDRHVKALADSVLKEAKDAGVKPLGIEGERDAEWVLIDLNDVIVHTMTADVRDFYGLEKLWSVDGETKQEDSKA
ncbi:MAG: ribosome silencing factor [Gammaproteobacteria bacterium]|nr:ribosome silencing factor [Gammaproteobacteria bacterium]